MKMTQEQKEKRIAFAEALKAAISASEGVVQDGWDVPLKVIVDAMKRGVESYSRTN